MGHLRSLFGIEMVLNFNLTLSNDTIALYVTAISPTIPSQTLMCNIARVWISSSDAAAVTAKGFRIIHAASNSFYLVRSIELLCFPLDLMILPLGGIGLRRRRVAGRQPHRQQLV